jgi:hypothetical protein
MEQYRVTDVKDFFDEVFVKILYMNVDIKIIVLLIKTNVINVDIVDGSMFVYSNYSYNL